MIDPMLYEYFETGEGRFIEEAMSYMLDWWRFHEDGGAATRFFWNDMATGIRAMRLAILIDLLRTKQLVSDEKSTTDLLAMAERHIANLRDPELINRGNHGIFQIHGLRLLCAIAEFKRACDGEREYSDRMMLELLDHQFTSEGVHKEDSPSYHLFATKMFVDLIDQKWYGVGDALTERVRRAKLVQPWLIFPNGEIARFGDSEGSKNGGFCCAWRFGL